MERLWLCHQRETKGYNSEFPFKKVKDLIDLTEAGKNSEPAVVLLKHLASKSGLSEETIRRYILRCNKDRELKGASIVAVREAMKYYQHFVSELYSSSQF